MSKTMKYLNLIPVVLASAILLSGCVRLNSNTGSVPVDVSRNNECLNLKQQLVLNDDVSGMPERLGANPNQAARLYKEYERLQCDAVIAQAKARGVSGANRGGIDSFDKKGFL
ncbi:MAG: hypothetical protein K0Q74_1074 [Gammaproteobacteria bacterium]|nr:hypothetical protein [Gammaproteobacteria bacterium]